MNNADQPAFPGKEISEYRYNFTPGITKREYFAAMALQGLLSNPDYNRPSLREKMVTTPNTAKAAISYADALLQQLETTKPKP